MLNAQNSYPQSLAKRSWDTAYKAFLFNRDESLALKVAPMFILLGTPEVIVSNLVSVVGELADIGGFGILVVVVFRTYTALQKYR